ncbi:MAG: DUF262 domain-containing protein [Clostridia bacterium]|nr:DUF262 domain-containing protein [Clostridia bacterium]
MENEHDLEQIQKIIEKINLDKKGQGILLQTKTLGDIVNSDRPFYIKNYQRGYRWSKTEITELLKDVYAIDSEHYCMQPIVVAECDEDLSNKKRLKDIDSEKKVLLASDEKHEQSYELIDGQQRLTTIWIIRQCLSQYGAKLDNYEVYYELNRGVDEYYLNNAVTYIDEFFKTSSRTNAQIDQKKIERFVKNLEKLFFIWYEVDSNQNAVFKSLNAGKIPLTNAELFKAMLLNEDDDKQNSSVYERIAFEWDAIEKSLRNDDFWYFISNDTSDEKTRIDYVLEVYANRILENLEKPEKDNLDIDKERFSFLAIQKYMQNKVKSAQDIWQGVVETYNTLYSWYKNDDLYHAIGFLVASKNKKVGSKATASEVILELYKNHATEQKSVLVGVVQRKIYETYFQKTLENKKTMDLTIADCGYDKLPKAHLRAILLMSNIYATYYAVDKEKRVLRFPFHIYKANRAENVGDNEHFNFDIEHIKPQTIAMLDGNEGEFLAAVKALKAELECDLNEAKKSPDKELDLNTLQENINEIDAYVRNKNDMDAKKACKRIWNEYAQKHNDAPDNELSNLVLLNSDINRSYHNAFFNEKRKRIIEEDKSGVYIPICTKNAFLKYYGNQDKDANLIWWTQSDKDNYNAELTNMFEMIREWGNK